MFVDSDNTICANITERILAFVFVLQGNLSWKEVRRGTLGHFVMSSCFWGIEFILWLPQEYIWQISSNSYMQFWIFETLSPWRISCWDRFWRVFRFSGKRYRLGWVRHEYRSAVLVPAMRPKVTNWWSVEQTGTVRGFSWPRWPFQIKKIMS